MQSAGFPSSYPAHSRSPREWRASSRLWVLLCLLPLLLMSVMGQAPHSHELRSLARVLHQEQLKKNAIFERLGAENQLSSINGRAKTERVATQLALQASESHEEDQGQSDCPLCYWSSVAVALLTVSLSLLWPLLTATLCPGTSSFSSFAFPLSLRSRAPPIQGGVSWCILG